MTLAAEARVIMDSSVSLFRRAVDAVVNEKTLSDSNSRSCVIEREGRELLASSDPSLRPHVERIVASISECIDARPSERSIAARRESAQFEFARARFDVCSVECFYELLDITLADPILIQSVNQKIFDNFLVEKLSPLRVLEEAASRQVDMTETECNIVRYAAGSIPFKLLKKRNEPAVIACLNDMRSRKEDHAYRVDSAD